jgi:hypothetical protein
VYSTNLCVHGGNGEATQPSSLVPPLATEQSGHLDPGTNVMIGIRYVPAIHLGVTIGVAIWPVAWVVRQGLNYLSTQ